MLGGAVAAGVRSAGRDWTTVERAVTSGEIEATLGTGLVRGGREAPHFVADAVPQSAEAALRRLALPSTPTHKITLQVPADALTAARRVRPAFGQPGGGSERLAEGQIRALIRAIEPLK